MSERLLLVDDEEDIRRFLGMFLADLGYEVHAAENGAQALELLESVNPSIVLTDIKMPGMDGMELLKQVKARSPETEVVTARRVIAFLEDRRVFYNPYNMEMEYQCVNSILETRKFLTETIGVLSDKSELAAHLRAIRAACRQFVDTMGEPGHPRRGRKFHGPFEVEFFQALGQLRATAGIHIGAIAVMYGLSVEGSLAEILPPVIKEEDDNA